MNVVFKCVLAYLLSSIVFILGILLGNIWVELYREPMPENVIDLPQLLAEQMAPAIVSVLLSNAVFQKIFPQIKKRNLAVIILYIIMLLYYVSLIPQYYANKAYSDFIYVITGIITVLVVFYISKEKNKAKEIS